MANIPDFGPIFEPESAANEDNQPQYPYNRVTQTPSGHSFELDDTPDRERIRLMHRTGTFIEMHPNGDEVHKVYGDGFEITVSNKYVIVHGECKVVIEGDSSVHVKGNKYERIDGDYSAVVNGNYSVQVEKELSMTGKEVAEFASGVGGSAGEGGDLYLNVGGNLHINGGLDVEGSIRCGNVLSTGRVDAALGMSAGPFGFVSIFGGLSIGVPVAIPGTISCIGIVNAGIMVNTPLVECLISDAIFMTDNVNTSLHNCHFHIGFKGPTGPPIPGMI